MRYSSRFLASFVLLPLLASISLKAAPINGAGFNATDTMVNYCKLIRAAHKYGQLSTENKPVLTDLEVKEFNDIWQDVFDVAFDQPPIANHSLYKI